MDTVRRFLFYGLILCIPFAGTFGYLVGSNLLFTQLALDSVYIAVLALTLIYCRQNHTAFILPPALKIPLGIAFLLALTTFLGANVSQHLSTEVEMPLLMGLLGLKTLLGYIFIIPCVYYLLRDQADLIVLFRLYVSLVLVCCALGIVQYSLFRVGVCGVADAGESGIKAVFRAGCLVGGSFLYLPDEGLIRLPGTFATPLQWELFLISSVFFCVGAASSDRNWYWRWAAGFAILLVWICALLAGQRLGVWAIPISLVIVLSITMGRRFLRRSLYGLVGLCVAIALVSILNPTVIQTQVSAIHQWQTAAYRGNPFFFEVGWALDKTNLLLGKGLGRATNSARILGETRLLTAHPAKLIYEMGIPGLVAMVELYTTVVLATFRAYRLIRSPELSKFALSLWFFVISFSYVPFPFALESPPTNIYYWLATGIVLRLSTLERAQTSS